MLHTMPYTSTGILCQSYLMTTNCHCFNITFSNYVDITDIIISDLSLVVGQSLFYRTMLLRKKHHWHFAGIRNVLYKIQKGDDV